MGVIQMSDFKKGLVIDVSGEPMVVLNWSQAVMGRGSSVLKAKLRNIQTGATRDITVKSGDKFDEVEVINKMGQFLYNSGEEYSFMDSETYEQCEFTKEQLGEQAYYLTDGLNLHIVFVDGTPVGIKLPPKVELKVVSAPPGVKGDTAQGGTKPVKLETGYNLNVPLFVNEGETIRVNTETGEYVERVR